MVQIRPESMFTHSKSQAFYTVTNGCLAPMELTTKGIGHLWKVHSRPSNTCQWQTSSWDLPNADSVLLLSPSATSYSGVQPLKQWLISQGQWTHNKSSWSTRKSVNIQSFHQEPSSLPWPGLGTLFWTYGGWQSCSFPVVMMLHHFYLLSRTEKAAYVRAKLTCGKKSLRVLMWTCCPFLLRDRVRRVTNMSSASLHKTCNPRGLYLKGI